MSESRQMHQPLPFSTCHYHLCEPPALERDSHAVHVECMAYAQAVHAACWWHESTHIAIYDSKKEEHECQPIALKFPLRCEPVSVEKSYREGGYGACKRPYKSCFPALSSFCIVIF